MAEITNPDNSLPKKESFSIEIHNSQRFPVASDEKLIVEEVVEEQRIPFFGSISKNKETTWIISLFVFVLVVAFFVTMVMNNCWTRSHGQCTLLLFQPLSENPLLGPSFSVLDHMGALGRLNVIKNHGVWRLFTSVLLHAGAFHLIINVTSIIFIGINLEQKYGSLRTGIVYILSALTGALLAALFIQKRVEVCSSGALFGLIGASISGLVRDWPKYTKKFRSLIALFLVFIINAALGLLPYVDNFANIGGFISGILLGFALFFSPHLRKPTLHKGLFDYGGKRSMTLKEKFDRPVLRIIALLLFSLMLAGLVVAILGGIEMNKYCSWCQYIDCLPSRNWRCNINFQSCQASVSRGQTEVICMGSGKFKILPYADILPSRLEELCSLICS